MRRRVVDELTTVRTHKVDRIHTRGMTRVNMATLMFVVTEYTSTYQRQSLSDIKFKIRLTLSKIFRNFAKRKRRGG